MDIGRMFVILVCLVALCGYGDEKVEQEVVCPQCHGSGEQTRWIVCPECNGTAEITMEIRNASMDDIRVIRARKPKKLNRQRCQNCVKSAKRGKIKGKFDCPKCRGSGKITIIVSNRKSKSTRRNNKGVR